VDRSAHHEDIREDAQGEPLRSAGRGGRAGNPSPCFPRVGHVPFRCPSWEVGFCGSAKGSVGCWGVVGAVAVIVGKITVLGSAGLV
jgi:hypothetical protein